MVRKETVSKHRRRIGRGKHKDRLVSVSQFRRKAKPKRKENIKIIKQKFEVEFRRDDQGRIVGKKTFRRI